MKNIIRFLGTISIAIVPVIVMAQSGRYTINGKIAPLAKPTQAYLIYNNSTGKQTDSTLISNNGYFIFAGTITDPENAYIEISKNRTGIHIFDISYISIYLEPGTIMVISPDSLENAKITGGKINADYNKLQMALTAGTRGIIEGINKAYETASVEKRESKAFKDSLTNLNELMQKDEKAVYLAFIKDNPNSLVSLFALESYAGASPDGIEIDSIFNSLSKNVRSSGMGTRYAITIEKIKHTAIGVVAPDFTMADTAGRAISLHDFKGKYVLVDFWASWCGPCRGENPNLLKAYGSYKNKNFTILGVSLDSPGAKDKWLKAIHEDHLTWSQVSDLQGRKNTAAQLYGVQFIPENFLVSPDGKIIAKNMRGEQLNNKLKELLDK